MDRKVLINKILEIEFHLFNLVKVNASEPCDAERDDFFNQRRAQFVPWGSYTLKSYLGDLETALKEGDNPIAQKYHYMQKEGPLDVENSHIDLIVQRNITWQREMMARYPSLTSQGRALSRSESGEVPFVNYLLCELACYSSRTLRLLHADVEQMHQIGVNMCEVIYDALVKQYGHPSLAAAEAALAEKAPSTSAPNRR